MRMNNNTTIEEIINDALATAEETIKFGSTFEDSFPYGTIKKIEKDGRTYKVTVMVDLA